MIWDHDRNRKLIDGTQAGQNIWQSSSSMKSKFGVQHVMGAMKNWYLEVKQYNPRNIRSFRFDFSVISTNQKEHSDSPRPYHGPQTGHYTAIVWADTDQVGCGQASYVKYGQRSSYVNFLVCNYATAGNVIGPLKF